MGDELEQLRERNAELERELAESTAALAAVQREFDHFANSVSHDLRAPLRHIAAFAGMLERIGLGTREESERSAVQAIKEAADRMNQLIDDLLRLSRAGRAELHRAPVPLQDVVRQAQNDLAPEALGRKINWRIHPLPIVQADPPLLRQVFAALLSNAIKFTRPRNPAEVEIGAREERGRWVIYVRDNGAGFDQKFVGRLFGIFQRLHSEREFEGTGSGLAVVRKIIARHGGETWAEGCLNEGATFYFSLPKD
ncbi:MAG TPA: ATP-binding protein [Candidatus Binatia bacterium]|nr:ATP-binding protein [Candidatus Binatia bacterium]